MDRPDLPMAKQYALSVLEDFGLTEPPVNPTFIARELGVDVFFVKFAEEHSRISGFYDCTDDAIFVNEDEYPLRQTFTIAHELGHRIMHRDWAASNDYTVLMRDEGSDRNKYELEADEFAGNLLMPRHMLDKYVSHSDRGDLSKLFAVSIPSVNVRLSKEYGI